MKDPHDYPATVLASSERSRSFSDGSQAWNDEPPIINRPPARPSTQTARGPRTENLASRGRHSSETKNGNSVGKKRSELTSLQQKAAESDLAKNQGQEHLKRQDAEVVKLEHYIRQLIDERGGIDKNIMKSIVSDLEKSALVKRTQKQFADLKDELIRKEQQLSSLKGMLDSNHVLRPVEANESTVNKSEKLNAQSNEHATRDGNSKVLRSSRESTKPERAELERLWAQNSAMRAEIASLRSELHTVYSRERKSHNHGGEGGDSRSFSSASETERTGNCRRSRDHASNGEVVQRTFNPKSKHDSNNGPVFYEGQAVECRTVGSGTWKPAVVDSVHLISDTVGSSRDRGSKTYAYTVWFDRGGSENNVPEVRIRSAKGYELDDGGSPCAVHQSGGTIIRMRVFRPGEIVFARDSGSKGKWSRAEVVRRDTKGMYYVLFDGRTEEHVLHPTMLRSTDDLKQNTARGHHSDGGDAIGIDEDSRGEYTKSVVASPAEKAELRYAEQRETLLEAARYALPELVKVGHEVLARYPGREAWGAGTVVGQGKDEVHLSVDFDSGNFTENLPFIFTTPRLTGNLLSDQTHVFPGDAVLAQKDDTSSSDDWYPARFKRYENDGYCSLVFVGEETLTSIRTVRAHLLYGKTKNDGLVEIPGVPPPPTKPVRAKKHRDGDLVLACIPKIKAWAPALVTGSKGHGRYSVEWADGEKSDSLLFMFMATLGYCGKGDTSATVTGRHPLSRDRPSGSSNVRHNDRALEGDNVVEGTPNVLNPQSCVEGDVDDGTSKSAKKYVRLRQPQLKVGEPVLAKSLHNSVWAPGSIKKVLGDGRYDVLFTDGSNAEGLSFIYIRTLDLVTLSENGGDSPEMACPANRDEHKVGDTVYVLKRGQSPENTPLNMRNRELWRTGVIAGVSNDRYTVVYDGEEGRPQESRIPAGRVRPRQRIRQKAAEKGDAVLALSKKPGRGWMMGTIAGRTGNGVYKIEFSDGSEEDGIRFANLRHVESNDGEEDKQNKTDKPVMRAIRQRRFYAGELALARHPESRKWSMAKVLEARPDGRYDLKLFGGGDPVVRGVSFQSLRHIDRAQIPADNTRLAGWETRGGGDKLQPLQNGACIGDRTLGRSASAKTKEDRPTNHRDVNDKKDGTQKSSSDMGDDVPALGTRAGLNAGSDVYVLRRGKCADTGVEGTSAWRTGKIVSIRGNGSLVVEYDEPGHPKEDRVAVNRVRQRYVVADGCVDARSGDSNAHSPRHERFSEGDVVVAYTEESDKVSLVEVEANLGLSTHRVSFLDGSGSTEVASHQLRHLKNLRQAGQVLSAGGEGIISRKSVVKMRKLRLGELVLAQRDCTDGKDRSWFAATVLESEGGGIYSLLFEGDEDPTRIHFTRIRPLKMGDEGGEETRDNGPRLTDITTESSKRDKRDGIIGRKTEHAGLESLVLYVSEVSFNLSTAASAARRTLPYLILATGERGEPWDAPWLHSNDVRSSGDQERFIVRGRARPGSRNPTWIDEDKDVFRLSLEGLEEPALFLGLENGRAKASAGHRLDGSDGGRVSEEAILAEGYMPVLLEEACTGGRVADVDLENGAGTVRLRWSTQSVADKRQ